MQTEYGDIFGVRGSAYDIAMQLFPHARDREFAQAIAAAQPRPGMRVADVPAGGGYLARHLPAGCEWLGHEPCEAFVNHGAAATSHALLPLPWATAGVDVAISLAGVHHIADKRPLFAELNRVVRPGGRLVVSDVQANSAVAEFLDRFVGQYNSTGHEGIFLDGRTLAELEETGWRIETANVADFLWLFVNTNDMASFCGKLFDIREQDNASIEAEIRDRLGIVEMSDGQVGMNWSLMTIVAHRQ